MDEFVQTMIDTVCEELKPEEKKENDVLSNVAYGVGQGLADKVSRPRRLPQVSDENENNSPEPEFE